MSRKSLKLILGSFLVLGFLTGCGPKYPNCETDKHCAEQGEVCVDGTCKQCRDNTQCTESCQVCSSTSFTCGRAPGCCTSDLDCGGSAPVCHMNGATGECGPKCNDRWPCEAGQKCVGGDCVPSGYCGADADCESGQICENNACAKGCRTPNVNFDFDEHVLDSAAIEQINSNAECLKSMEGNVQLDGYADERGDDEYNLALGKRRSASVKRSMQRMLRGRSIKTMSYGEEGALCFDQSETCWSRNRRVQTSVR